MSTALPLDESAPDRAQPWVLHILEVNTMNFCSFASCIGKSNSTLEGLLIAVPNTLETEAVSLDIACFPWYDSTVKAAH